MRLYVDDLRKCPEGWTLARTNTEAIRLLSSGYVMECSIDHDICVPFNGELSGSVKRRLMIGQETFMPVVYYIIAQKPDNRPDKIIIHTANIVAGLEMVKLLKDAGIESTYQQGSYNIELGDDL